MLCKLCVTNTQKVGIGDDYNLFTNSDNNIFITLKNSHKIHLFHLNKSFLDGTNLSVKQETCVDQPKSSTDIDPGEASKFSDLLSCQTLSNQTNRNGFNVRESSDYSLIYRNEIKLDKICKNSGDSQGLPLLFFIHGVGGNGKIWTNQMEFFYAKGYEMIAIDLLGHGKTSCSKDKKKYEFLEMALDVLLIFDMFSKSDNIVIGHSYGCSFATYLSQCRQDVISKIILISGGSPHPLDFKSSLLKLPMCLIQLIHPIISCHFFCSAFSSYCKKPVYSDETFNISAKTLFYTMQGQVWPEGNEQYHRKINQPVLLIEGENDKLVPIEDALDLLLIIKSGYLIVMKKGSHMVLIEKVDLVNKLIYLFLNDSFL